MQSLLLLAGDVETNPNKEAIQEILKSQKDVAKNIKEMRKEQLSLKESFNSINKRLSTIEATIDEVRGTAKFFKNYETKCLSYTALFPT